MKRILVVILLLTTTTLLALLGRYAYMNGKIRHSVVFQDSETSNWSIDIDKLEKEEIVRRLLNANPIIDAQRAYSIWDRRLVGFHAHYLPEVPGLLPNFAVTQAALRLKLIAVPDDDDKLRWKARLYCAEYNAYILAKVTGKSSRW